MKRFVVVLVLLTVLVVPVLSVGGQLKFGNRPYVPGVIDMGIEKLCPDCVSHCIINNTTGEVQRCFLDPVEADELMKMFFEHINTKPCSNGHRR